MRNIHIFIAKSLGKLWLKEQCRRIFHGPRLQSNILNCINHYFNLMSYITVELFPRKTRPIYPEHTSTEDKKYITWKTANEDIEKQRSQGYKGQKFMICPKLVNKNKGKTRIIEKIWNKKFNQYVPKHWARSSDCEVRKVKVPLEPVWEYHIISIKRL